MSEKAFVWIIRAVSFIGIVATIFVVWSLPPYLKEVPEMKNISGIILFYASLMVSLSGVFSLIIFWLRRKTHGEDLQNIHMGVSLRQGILIALIAIIMLVLQSFRVLVWWDALLAIGAVMMVELYFLAR